MFKHKINLTKSQFKKWVADLRSGKYKQGRWALATPVTGRETEFCCLGVLAEQLCSAKSSSDVDLGYWAVVRYQFPESLDPSKRSYTTTIPSEVIDMITQRSLMALNDSDQKSFEQIARIIEKKLKPSKKE